MNHSCILNDGPHASFYLQVCGWSVPQLLQHLALSQSYAKVWLCFRIACCAW